MVGSQALEKIDLYGDYRLTVTDFVRQSDMVVLPDDLSRILIDEGILKTDSLLKIIDWELDVSISRSKEKK